MMASPSSPSIRCPTTLEWSNNWWADTHFYVFILWGFYFEGLSQGHTPGDSFLKTTQVEEPGFTFNIGIFILTHSKLLLWLMIRGRPELQAFSVLQE